VAHFDCFCTLFVLLLLPLPIALSFDGGQRTNAAGTPLIGASVKSGASLLAPLLQTKLRQISFPSYAVDNDLGLFATRRQFDDWLGRHLHYSFLLDASISQKLDSHTLLATLQQVHSDWRLLDVPSARVKFRQETVLSKLLVLFAELLEKQKEWKTACDIYSDLLRSTPHCLVHLRVDWWERLIILTGRHLGKKDVAFEACLDALHDPFTCPHKRITFGKKLEKLAKASKSSMQQLEGYFFKEPTFCVVQLELEHLKAADAPASSRVLLANQQGAIYKVEEFVLQVISLLSNLH
jgi:hypothetical protein